MASCNFLKLFFFAHYFIHLLTNLLEIDGRLKQFCFLIADCLVVGKSQFSAFGWKYTRNHCNPEGDSQTIEIHIISLIDIFASDVSEIQTCVEEVSS